MKDIGIKSVTTESNVSEILPGQDVTITTDTKKSFTSTARFDTEVCVSGFIELQDKSIVEAKLSSRGNASVAGMSQTWSLESRLSSCSKYWLWTKRLCHSYIVYCCSLPPVQTDAPYFLSRLLLLTSCADCCSLLPEQTAAPYFLSRLLLLTSCADCCSLLPELLLLLMRRHCSLPHEETLLSSLGDITSPHKETLRHCSLPPEETLLHLLRRHCSLPPEETLLHLLKRHCFLPPEETLLHLIRRHCSLPPEETLLLLLRRHCSIVIASGPEVAFVNPATPADRSNMEWFCLRNVNIAAILVSTPEETVATCPDHIMGAKAKAAAKYEFSIGGVSIGGSPGVSPSEVHEERLHQKFPRSVSTEGSRGASPLEVHEERLHRRFTRSVSIRGSRGASPLEVHEERLHRRFTRSVSMRGLRGASPSEVHDERLHQSFARSVSIGDTSIEDASSGRGFEGVTKGRGAIMNKLNEDADPNEAFPDDGFDNDHSHI
ncbi:hypothetical protein Tco_0327278 [Tanacetum coccineum]